MIADAHRRTEEALARFGPEAIRAAEIADLWNDDPRIPPLPTLLREIEAIRARGYAISMGAIALGAGIICVLLPTNPGEQPLGLGVAGLSAIIERDRDRILETIVEEAGSSASSSACHMARAWLEGQEGFQEGRVRQPASVTPRPDRRL